MNLLNTLSLPFGDSEAAVVPGLEGSGLPSSPVPEQHVGEGHGTGGGREYGTLLHSNCYFGMLHLTEKQSSLSIAF